MDNFEKKVENTDSEKFSVKVSRKKYKKLSASEVPGAPYS